MFSTCSLCFLCFSKLFFKILATSSIFVFISFFRNKKQSHLEIRKYISVLRLRTLKIDGHWHGSKFSQKKSIYEIASVTFNITVTRKGICKCILCKLILQSKYSKSTFYIKNTGDNYSLCSIMLHWKYLALALCYINQTLYCIK